MKQVEAGTLQHVIDWNRRIAWYWRYIHEIDQIRRTLETIKEYFVASKSLKPIANNTDWNKRIAMVTKRTVDDDPFFLGDIIWVKYKIQNGGYAYCTNRKGDKMQSEHLHMDACMYLDLPDSMDMTMPDRHGNLGHILLARHNTLTAGADNPKAKNVHLGKMRRGVENDTRFWSSCYDIVNNITSEVVGEIRTRTSDIEKDDNGEVMIGACVVKVESFEEKRVTRKVVRPDDHIPPWTDGIEVAMTIVILAARFDFILAYADVYGKT